MPTQPVAPNPSPETEPATQTLAETQTETEPNYVPGPEPDAPVVPPGTQSSPQPSPYRPKGKIASLPKEQRDLINRMLVEGNTYAAISRKMSDQGVSLNAENLSNWQHGGHQDWLYDQQWREDTRALQESALDVMGDAQPAKFNQAALQVASLQIFAALRHLRRGTLDEKLGGDSSAFARLVNALSRATRETLNAQKYQDACARARAALRELKDPKRKLSDDERRHLILQVDEILGLPTDDEASSPQPVQSPGFEVQDSPLTQPAIGISALPPIENQKPTTENPPPQIATAE